MTSLEEEIKVHEFIKLIRDDKAPNCTAEDFSFLADSIYNSLFDSQGFSKFGFPDRHGEVNSEVDLATNILLYWKSNIVRAYGENEDINKATNCIKCLLFIYCLAGLTANGLYKVQLSPEINYCLESVNAYRWDAAQDLHFDFLKNSNSNHPVVLYWSWDTNKFNSNDVNDIKITVIVYREFTQLEYEKEMLLRDFNQDKIVEIFKWIGIR